MIVAARIRGSLDGSAAGVVVVEVAIRASDKYSGLSDNYTTPRTR